jgi:hypothetical protein
VTAVLLPPVRAAARHPGVRLASVLLLGAPLFVAYAGPRDEASVRLRFIGLLVAACAALVWDDRCHDITAPTPVGLPAVRRGRALVIATLLTGAWALACIAVPTPAPLAAVTLQLLAMTALLLAIVGWLSRNGDSVLAVPFPAVLILVAVLNRLPHQVALLRSQPGDPAWAAERLRWWVLLAASAAVVWVLQRDPASRLARPSSRLR